MPALETMRVLDFTQWEAGPTCGQYLAWLGADVVKLESPAGDPGRHILSEDGTDSQYFCNHNGNKRAICLNLKTAQGTELLRRLVTRFDVLVENQGPGVLERLGFGPEALHELNPRLIIARIKGFGLSGPYANYKSFDPLAMAAAGITSMTGTAESGPISPGGTFADTGTGVHAAFAIAAAYVQQQRTGEGQVIELSMHEVMTMFSRTLASWNWGPEARPTPARSEGVPPSGRWRCAGDGPADYVLITAPNDDMWVAFCHAVGRPELVSDDRFAKPGRRVANAQALRDEVQSWFAARSKQEAMAELGSAGVPVSATFDTSEVFNDPHLQARNFFVTVDHPEKGEMLMMTSPIRLSASNVPLTRAPLFGEHTREVLAQELGLSDAELDQLVTSGAAVVPGSS
jgi:formyl-CoA transferase